MNFRPGSASIRLLLVTRSLPSEYSATDLPTTRTTLTNGLRMDDKQTKPSGLLRFGAKVGRLLKARPEQTKNSKEQSHSKQQAVDQTWPREDKKTKQATCNEPVTGTAPKDELSPKNSANPNPEAIQKTYDDGEHSQPSISGHAADKHPKPRSIEEAKANVDKAMKRLDALISAKLIEIPKEVTDVDPSKVTDIEHTARTIQWAMDRFLPKLKVKSEKQKPIRDMLVKWFRISVFVYKGESPIRTSKAP